MGRETPSPIMRLAPQAPCRHGRVTSNVRPHDMLPRVALALLTSVASTTVHAQGFAGNWDIDLRNAEQRKNGVECGGASFELSQEGNRIRGSHSMVTAGCGRQNEGGPETVKGVVLNGKAVLVVTSTRNRAVVMGVAQVKNGRLQWQVLEEIRASEQEGDSPLILHSGVLLRRRQ